MEQKIILAIVIIVGMIAHLLILRWIKFKMDEGAILKYLKDAQLNQNSSVAQNISLEGLSEAVAIRAARVEKVCQKSAGITVKNGTYLLRSEK